MVGISKAFALRFWRNILKMKKESTWWAPHLLNEEQKYTHVRTARKLRSAVGNVSGYRCVSEVPSSIPVRSHTFVEIDHEIISAVILLPSADFIQEGLLSFTSESMCTNHWLTTCSSLPRKKCG